MVSISPQYLPPKENNKKRKQKWILLAVFLFILITSLTVFFLFFGNKNDKNKEPIYSTYQICGLEPKHQQALFEEREELETIGFEDYLFYGESFSVFKNKYELGQVDEFVGKTIQFRDVCTGTIHSFLVNHNLDTNVPLEDIPVGFYEVVIQQNLDAYRLIHPTEINETFYTITRDNKRHELHFIADRMLFTDIYTQDLLLSGNELFVEVKETDVDPNIVDVVLDPAYNSQDFGPVNKGLELDGFTEADETYRFALDVQKKLEEHGLTVKLTRPNDELVVNTYGDTGRVFAALDSKAKVMVELYFETVEDRNLEGTSVYGTYYASLNFQEQIIKQFEKQGLPIFIGSRNQYGAFHNLLTDGLDSNNLIRESGGYALSAGEFSEISARLNEFAIGNRFGVHTVSLNLLMSSNYDFLSTYQQNYDKMVEATTQGILSYLGIKQ